MLLLGFAWHCIMFDACEDLSPLVWLQEVSSTLKVGRGFSSVEIATWLLLLTVLVLVSWLSEIQLTYGVKCPILHTEL